jgi:hypothetical protein
MATLDRRLDLLPNEAFIVITIVQLNRVVRFALYAELLARSGWD